MPAKPAPASAITVSRDPQDPALFHVSGRRVSGRVRASIHFKRNDNTYGIRENVEPEEIITVHVSMNLHRDETLSINGVGYDGYRSGQINDPWQVNRRRDGYLHRSDGDFRAKISDAAYEVWSEVTDQVAALFGTDDAVHAARVTKAAQNEAQAFADLRQAEEALKDARDAHRAVILAGAQPVKRPVVEEV